MKYEVKVFKSIEKDSWANGCALTGGQDFGCIEKREFKTLNEAFSYVDSFGTEPFIFDDRIEIQATENDDGVSPSNAEINAFKEGKIDLWCANYSFYVSKVERTELSHADLVAAFPNLSAEAS